MARLHFSTAWRYTGISFAAASRSPFYDMQKQGALMKALKTASLRSRLYLLILVIFIPGCALLIYAAAEQQRSEKEAILSKAMMIARSAASEESQQVESARHLLAATAAPGTRTPWRSAG